MRLSLPPWRVFTGTLACLYLIRVKVVPLVAVPPGVLTEIAIEPGFRPFFGTVAVICVPEASTVKLAFLPLNITAVASVKFAPLIVTEVPPGPLIGVKSAIVGAGITVKPPTLVAVPTGVVTAMGPLVAPTGTMAVIFLPLLLIVNWALAPPIVTLVAPFRLWPLIVTDAPSPPLSGKKLVIVGGGLLRTVKPPTLVVVPPGVVTVIGPLMAPVGTVVVI